MSLPAESAADALPARRDAPSGGLRVLHVIPGEETGTTMIFAKREAHSLEPLGVTGERFFLSSRTSLRRLLQESRRFRKTLASFDPEVVHAHFGTMTGLFCVLSTRIPVVISYRGSDLNFEPGRFLRSAGKVFLSQLAALFARSIICVSAGLKEKLWWRKEIAQVIPSGLDVDLFTPFTREAARAELGWKMSDRVVLFNAGGGRSVKRPELARAAVTAAEKIVGDIRFAVLDGSVDGARIPVWMNAADCLLLTSKAEGSPTVVKEAIACNLPVVTVDVGDVRELLSGIRPSHIVDDDPASLANALADVLSRPGRSNGRDKIRRLSLESVAARIVEVYRRSR